MFTLMCDIFIMCFVLFLFVFVCNVFWVEFQRYGCCCCCCCCCCWRTRREGEEEVSLGVIMINTEIFHIFHIISIFNLPFFSYFPYLFTIQFTFPPYFQYLFTFQLTFLPYLSDFSFTSVEVIISNVLCSSS